MSNQSHPHNLSEDVGWMKEVVVESGRLWKCGNHVKMEKVVPVEEVVQCRSEPESLEVPMVVMEEVF